MASFAAHSINSGRRQRVNFGPVKVAPWPNQQEPILGICGIVTTPNLEILSGQFVTLMTGCNNPWMGRLAKCAQISIDGGE